MEGNLFIYLSLALFFKTNFFLCEKVNKNNLKIHKKTTSDKIAWI